jgi:hypothetical protein
VNQIQGKGQVCSISDTHAAKQPDDKICTTALDAFFSGTGAVGAVLSARPELSLNFGTVYASNEYSRNNPAASRNGGDPCL